MTTLSQRELVSCSVEGSSSSQSASLLVAYKHWLQSTKSKSIRDPLVQLLRLLHNLLLVLHIAFGWCVLLRLVTEIRCDYLHLPSMRRFPESEVCIVKHLNRKIYTLGTEVHDECIPLEVALIIGVELYTRLASINLLSNDATARKNPVDLLLINVRRKVCNIDSRVLALAGFGCMFRLLGYQPTTFFLIIAKHFSHQHLPLYQIWGTLTSCPFTYSCFLFFFGRTAGSLSSTPCTAYAFACCSNNDSSNCKAHNHTRYAIRNRSLEQINGNVSICLYKYTEKGGPSAAAGG